MEIERKLEILWRWMAIQKKMSVGIGSVKLTWGLQPPAPYLLCLLSYYFYYIYIYIYIYIIIYIYRIRIDIMNAVANYHKRWKISLNRQFIFKLRRTNIKIWQRVGLSWYKERLIYRWWLLQSGWLWNFDLSWQIFWKRRLYKSALTAKAVVTFLNYRTWGRWGGGCYIFLSCVVYTKYFSVIGYTGFSHSVCYGCCCNHFQLDSENENRKIMLGI